MITLRQGVVVAGRYALVRELARGGMGSVWIARHRDLELDVTVKFMSASLVASAEARVRFEREAKVAARLRSQHVVQVHDYGVTEDVPFFVMELLKGESLSARLRRDGRLSLPVTARLVVQICKALRTAHEIALVHRDLKPSNIFLAQKDDDEVVKVLDFGVAKIEALDMNTANTESGVLLGTLHYMSPEQIRSSRDVDHRSDLWALGVILYRTLTGKLPFPGPNLGDILVRICTDPIEPALRAAPDLNPAIDGFFEKALARDRGERFQSAMELSEAFCAIAIEPAPRLSSPETRTVVLAEPAPVAAPFATAAPPTVDTTTVPAPETRAAPSPAPPPTSSRWAGPTLPLGSPPFALAASAPLFSEPHRQLASVPSSVPREVHASRARSAWIVAAAATVAAIFVFALRSGSPPQAAAVATANRAPTSPSTVATTGTEITPTSAAPDPTEAQQAVEERAPAPANASAPASTGSTGAATVEKTATPRGRPTPAAAPKRPAARDPRSSGPNPLDRRD